MPKTLSAALLILVIPSLAYSQDRKFAVGVSGSYSVPREDAIGSRASAGPFFRFVPKDGWGPAWGFTWFEKRFDLAGIGGPAIDGRLNIRPIMAGVSYTIARDATAVSFSFVGGYSFNRLRLFDESRRGPGNAHIENSPAFRPGVSLWHSLNSRVALTAFGGYVITRPEIEFDTEVRKLKADYGVASAGVAFMLF